MNKKYIMNIRDIKIRDGKITSLLGVRRCGMTTLLCSYIGKALEDGKRVLLVSYMMNCAMDCKKRLIDEYNNSISYDKLDVISISSLEDRLVGNRYDLVVIDALDIFETDWSRLISIIHGHGCSCVIGITWEDFTHEVVEMYNMIRDLSDFSYYITIVDGNREISLLKENE